MEGASAYILEGKYHFVHILHSERISFHKKEYLCKTCLKLLCRFLEEDSTCAEYGCSYSKDGSPGDVYCFRWVRRIYNGTSCRNGQQGKTKRVLLVVSLNLLSPEMATTRLKPEKNVPQNQQVETETCFQHEAAFSYFVWCFYLLKKHCPTLLLLLQSHMCPHFHNSYS